MIRQSQSNRNDSTTSQFQKSMLSKLDSLCSPDPTFDTLDTDASLSFNGSNASSNLRRRRLYHSPGALGALLSPAGGAASVLAARESKVQSFGNILAERARLVQKTLTRNTLASKQTSTPLRAPALLVRTKLTGSSQNSNPPAVSQTVSTPTRLTIKIKDGTGEPKLENSANEILTSLSAFEPSRVETGLLGIVEKPSSFTQSLCHRGTQSLCSSLASSTRRIRSHNRLSEAVESDILKLDSFSPKRRVRQTEHELRWFLLVSSTIKKMVEHVILPSDDISKCTCLQLALVATKQIADSNTDWLPQFIDGTTEFIKAARSCLLHKRCTGVFFKTKGPNIEKSQKIFKEEIGKNMVKWLQDSRAFLMERLSRNMQLLL